jgi:hypothetical protein
MDTTKKEQMGKESGIRGRIKASRLPRSIDTQQAMPFCNSLAFPNTYSEGLLELKTAILRQMAYTHACVSGLS